MAAGASICTRPASPAVEAEVEVLLKNQGMLAILVSPRMRSYETTHPDAALNFLFKGGNLSGWTSYPLAPGYQIFYRSS